MPGEAVAVTKAGKKERDKEGKMEIIQRGAEAVLYLDGRGRLVKERLRKGYRLPELDSALRRQRSRLEVRLLERARRSGVDVPHAQLSANDKITMDYVRGGRLKDVLDGMTRKEADAVARKVGETAAALHSSDIVHGDLTTSNMIMHGGKLYLIDFGLGKVSRKVEDKATDMFLLSEALQSTHFGISGPLWKNIINTYLQKYSDAREVLGRLAKIERRRRYK
jgi:Kae1-associated kinase Bud32